MVIGVGPGSLKSETKNLRVENIMNYTQEGD